MQLWAKDKRQARVDRLGQYQPVHTTAVSELARHLMQEPSTNDTIHQNGTPLVAPISGPVVPVWPEHNERVDIKCEEA